MANLDPKGLFDLIGVHVPKDLKPNILIIGSLAAAYHFRGKLQSGAINTKDADLVVRPAGATAECAKIAQRLIDEKWRRTEKCHAMPEETSADQMRAIRLFPPHSNAYFVELLGFPEKEQVEAIKWVKIKLDDGWYGLPSFKFLGLTDFGRLQADNGLNYAEPAMMALANLLSHPTLGTARMSEQIGGRSLLRSAKDLGRVIALASLGTREEVEIWHEKWERALKSVFPNEFDVLAKRAGNGFRELLEDPQALDEARHAVDIGLLAGQKITNVQMKAVGQRFLVDAIDPLAKRFSD
jgi:hypothetical protein